MAVNLSLIQTVTWHFSEFSSFNNSISRCRVGFLPWQRSIFARKVETRRPASADRTACCQFQATGQPVSRTQASDAMTSRLPCYEAKCVQRRCFQCQCGSVPLRSDIKGMELPPANISIPLEKQLIALQLCRWQFLYNETLQQTFGPVLSKLFKRRQIWVLYSHFEEIRGGVEPWLMACWKAHVEFLLSVIEVLFRALTDEVLQSKMCQNSLLSGGGRSLGAKISGRRGHPRANILIPLERQLIALQLCSWHFLYNETLQQTFCPVLSKLSKFRYFIPILRKLGAA